LSGVPGSYIQAWSALATIMGIILNAIYAYCDANKLLKITNLCVLASTGLPSLFEGESTSNNPEQAKKDVSLVYREIDKYPDWDKVIKANKFIDIDKIDPTKFINRGNFEPSLKFLLKEGTKEDIVEKVAVIENKLKIPGRITAILLFIFPIIFMVLAEGKIELNFAWLLWPPLCFALWSIDIILKLCLPRIDRAIGWRNIANQGHITLPEICRMILDLAAVLKLDSEDTVTPSS
jgi:hypothetical protein